MLRLLCLLRDYKSKKLGYLTSDLACEEKSGGRVAEVVDLAESDGDGVDFVDLDLGDGGNQDFEEAHQPSLHDLVSSSRVQQ